ncbi:hypothetical protein CBS63078_11018 [Aspergillus niger]|nr:hypothetical protein CBS133816_3234 [Aspergillus niger]KAI2856303.1 hypothetical protein CBS12448_6928 [Aspergillus niger]KAI2886258.1 hypothetical protein CBS63078_11018 [Aspergillus niger]KAI2922430.1 hypothetical protein CBS147371_2002 [Aspergillus niger]KAI2945568.1 hypothetical protein CBS147321_3815 [Aspergillus niger]
MPYLSLAGMISDHLLSSAVLPGGHIRCQLVCRSQATILVDTAESRCFVTRPRTFLLGTLLCVQGSQ